LHHLTTGLLETWHLQLEHDGHSMLFTLCGVYRLPILGMSDIVSCEYSVILLIFFVSSTEVGEETSKKNAHLEHLQTRAWRIILKSAWEKSSVKL
jgi:hypothetical protein